MADRLVPAEVRRL